jgi:hypothetical protein
MQRETHTTHKLVARLASENELLCADIQGNAALIPGIPLGHNL